MKKVLTVWLANQILVLTALLEACAPRVGQGRVTHVTLVNQIRAAAQRIKA